MWNVDFIFGLSVGAITVGLLVYLWQSVYSSTAEASDTNGQITDAVTAAFPITSQITETVVIPASRSTTLTIAPTLVSTPRRGRKPSAKTVQPATKKTAKKPTSKKSIAKKPTTHRTRSRNAR